MDLYDENGELVGYYPAAVSLPRTRVRQARKAGRHAKRDARQGRALGRMGDDAAEAAKDGYLIPSSSRRLSLPLGSTGAVAAGASATLTINVQKPFQAQKLVLESLGGTLAGWTVDDVKVGTRSQFASDGVSPATAFSATSVFAEFEMDPASPGILVTVDVTNNNVGADTLVGMIFGESIS